MLITTRSPSREKSTHRPAQFDGEHRRARGYFADDGAATGRVLTVYSQQRVVQMVELDGLKPSGAVRQGEDVLSLVDGHLSPPLELNVRHRMDGLDLMATLADDAVPAVFFDPQYRGVLDKLAYGNEGKARGRARASMVQMPEPVIRRFLGEIARILRPSGYLFLWTDKFHLCSGCTSWFAQFPLETVDLVTWDKGRMGMGYRTRRRAEYLLVAQKSPCRLNGVWKGHDLPDFWSERLPSGRPHIHQKPVGLQAALIGAVTEPGDLVVDPAAGSFSVMESARSVGRDFLGGDLDG